MIRGKVYRVYKVCKVYKVTGVLRVLLISNFAAVDEIFAGVIDFMNLIN